MTCALLRFDFPPLREPRARRESADCGRGRGRGKRRKIKGRGRNGARSTATAASGLDAEHRGVTPAPQTRIGNSVAITLAKTLNTSAERPLSNLSSATLQLPTGSAGCQHGLGSIASGTTIPRNAYNTGKGGPRHGGHHETVKASIVPT